MKQCRENKILISRYIDNDLDPLQCRILEAHMASCPSCMRVFNGYLEVKRCIHDHCGPSVPEMLAMKRSCADNRKKVVFSPFPAGLRLVAATVIVITLMSGFYFHGVHRKKVIMPFVLETQSRQIMNTPLGTLVYYEELAGATVHNQYSEFTTKNGVVMEDASARWDRISGYKSTLFCDSAVLEQRYSAIKNGSVY
jgi:hypothetical protein